MDWIDALKEADVLEKDAVTVAYSYIGPELTYPIYYDGDNRPGKTSSDKDCRGDQ